MENASRPSLSAAMAIISAQVREALGGREGDLAELVGDAIEEHALLKARLAAANHKSNEDYEAILRAVGGEMPECHVEAVQEYVDEAEKAKVKRDQLDAEVRQLSKRLEGWERALTKSVQTLCDLGVQCFDSEGQPRAPDALMDDLVGNLLSLDRDVNLYRRDMRNLHDILRIESGDAPGAPDKMDLDQAAHWWVQKVAGHQFASHGALKAIRDAFPAVVDDTNEDRDEALVTSVEALVEYAKARSTVLVAAAPVKAGDAVFVVKEKTEADPAEVSARAVADHRETLAIIQETQSRARVRSLVPEAQLREIAREDRELARRAGAKLTRYKASLDTICKIAGVRSGETAVQAVERLVQGQREDKSRTDLAEFARWLAGPARFLSGATAARALEGGRVVAGLYPPPAGLVVERDVKPQVMEERLWAATYLTKPPQHVSTVPLSDKPGPYVVDKRTRTVTLATWGPTGEAAFQRVEAEHPTLTEAHRAYVSPLDGSYVEISGDGWKS